VVDALVVQIKQMIPVLPFSSPLRNAGVQGRKLGHPALDACSFAAMTPRQGGYQVLEPNH